MLEPGATTRTGSRKKLIKALILVILAGISFGLVQFTSLKTYITPEQFQMIITETGSMGPALLMIFCVAGTCVFIPGTVLIGIGAAMYGPLLGFAYVWPGTLAGAAMAFLIARSLGREFVISIVGDKVRRYDDLIERNGFSAVLFLRLMCMPFAPLSYGMGLTKVRFLDFIAGTALGGAATIFIIAFSIGTLREIWISGEWGRLLSARIVLSAALLAFLLVMPKIVGKIRLRKPCGSEDRSSCV
jgi:uncharacterized membrane protein YdjX (TVP38/TMEM64 family)